MDKRWTEATLHGGAIVMIAKCPRPSFSKTRLIPRLGIDGAAKLAQAMLSDVLTSLAECVSEADSV
jgi:glycosyltransferase A (GT-A) superfamily protein (DUF2064 family)